MAGKPGRAGKPASYEDILALPENKVGEIADGELFRVATGRRRGHSLAASTLGGDLIGPFSRGRGGPGGWLILDEPELHLGADVLVPDIGGWRRERMPRCRPQLGSNWRLTGCVRFFRPPRRFSIERANSESTAATACPGCGSWIPLARLLEAWRLEHGEWILSAHSGVTNPYAFRPSKPWRSSFRICGNLCLRRLTPLDSRWVKSESTRKMARLRSTSWCSRAVRASVWDQWWAIVSRSRSTLPPVEGKANQAVQRVLAEAFGVPRSAVTILRGEAGKRKTVRIAGITAAVAMQLIAKV